jgi:uncharacterized protein YhaN
VKILRLDLLAFGPFTNVSLNLDKGSEGLHLIYGPNEAGKSSALRALRQLFFGIGGQTDDAFVHRYDKLRIGAVLRDQKGNRLEIIRRKGNKKTLRAGDDDTVVDDMELARFLGGLNEQLFMQRFGIDRKTLEAGGQSIGEPGSDLGELIFGAGLGSVTGLRAAQDGLRADMEELFTPKGRTQRINKTVAELRDSQTRIKQQQLSADEYQRHDGSLHEAQTSKARLDKEKQGLNREQSRLTRIRSALRLIPRRRELLHALEDCRDALVLPADFGKRWRDADQGFRLAEQQRQQAEQEKVNLKEQLTQIDVPEALLAEADAIERAQTNLGVYRKNVKDRAERLLQQKSDEHTAREILRSLGKPADLGLAESFRLTVAERQRVRELGHRHEAIQSRIAATLAEQTRLAGRLTQIRDLELGKLRLWSGTLEELEHLAVPSLETVDRFDNEISGAANQVATLERDLAKLEGELSTLQQQREQLELQGDVPTEAELLRTRQQRNQGWRLVRNAWLERRAAGPDEQAFVATHAPGGDLATAYEQSVATTDQVADRLRREADRVAKHAQLQAAGNQLLAQRDDLRRHLVQVQGHWQQIHGDWLDLWQPLRIAALTPREMRSWLNQQSKLVEQARTLRQDLRDADERARLAAEERTAWQAQWTQAVARLDLGADATPAQAAAVLDELDKLFQKLHDANGFAQRIAGIDRDIKRFEEESRGLVQRLALDIAALPADRAVEDLKTRLNRARVVATERDNCLELLQREEGKLRSAQETVQKWSVQLDVLCREACCTCPDELAEAERRSNLRRELETELRQIEEQLLVHGGGLTVPAFVAEAEQIDPDSVHGQLEKLDREIAEREGRISQLDQTIGGEQTELKKMRDSIGAAEIAGEAQTLIAQLQTDVQHYAVLRLAATVLHESIERYRQKNQNGVIERSGQLFAGLTGGSFWGLRIDEDDQEKPALKGIRSGNGETITVAAMSDGTQDQLYLALRLASVEEYLKEHEPIPFIVDDILLNFDNDRAVAALKALAELSRKTQVLFFTHHEHLVQLAEQYLDPAARFVYRIGC